MQEKSSLKFSIRLREALDNVGMMPGELAAKACVSKGYVSGLLNGTKTAPSVKICRKFSDVLGVSHLWLLGHDFENIPSMSAPTLREDETPYKTGVNPAPEPTLAEVFAKLHEALDMLRSVVEKEGEK